MFTKYLKAISALLILFCHINGAFFHSNDVWAYCVNTPRLLKNSWPNFFVKLSIVDYPVQLGFFAAFSVMTFFLCSSYGCFFSMEKKSFGKFLFTRFLKIYPIFFLSVIIDFIIIWLNSTIYNISINHSISDLLWQFCMSLQVIFGKKDILCVTWFLSVLVIYLFVNSICYYSYKKLRLKEKYFLYFADMLLLLLLLLLKSTEDYIVNSREVYKSLTFSVFMEVGYIFFLYQKKVIQHKTVFIMIFFQIIFSTILYKSFGATYVTVNEFLVYMIIVTSVFWISFLYSDKMKNGFLEKTYEISYVLYLFHGFFGFSLVQFFVVKFSFSKSLSCFIACFFTYYLSCLIHRYIEIPYFEKFIHFNKNPANGRYNYVS